MENQANNANQTAHTGQSTTQWQPVRRGLASNIFIVAAILCGVLLALYVWDLPPFKNGTVSTNNAYVRGKPTLISPKINGYIEKVLIQDFAQVEQGQPLVQIERDTYQAKWEQAQANLIMQQAALDKIEQTRQSALATVQVRDAAINSAQATLQNAQLEMKRQQELLRSNATSRQNYDNAQAALLQAQANFAQAKAQKTVAEQDVINVKANASSAKAAVENAKATLDLAQQDLDNTLIKAPVSGKLGEVGTRQGQYVSAGSALVYIVPAEHWVIANLKEGDTENIKVGQPVKIKVDALGGQSLDGKVSDISPATGSEFSLSKTDTSTGNFVKVAQRIAVKITIDPQQKNYERLEPGMSVEVAIDTN